MLSADGRSATLQMRALPVIDQPGWPEHAARATPATMSFRATWQATGERVRWSDPARHFRLEGWKAEARLEAEVAVPSLGFTWKSDPLETSSAAFAVIGDEVNGRYFDA